MNKWSKCENWDRWGSVYPHSLPYRIFKQYDCELMRFITTFESGKAYIYKNLGESGTLWTDLAKNSFSGLSNDKQTIEEWSDGFDSYGNWIRMSLLMSLCSYMETYFAAIVKECIISNPGVLFGLSHSIDGVKLLKEGKKVDDEIIKGNIVNCTKGDWSSRTSSFEKLFGISAIFDKKTLSTLDKIRNIRNSYGHAFGRNIEDAQDFFNIHIINMKRLRVTTFNKYHTAIRKLIMEIDSKLTQDQLGNFEPLYFYHNKCSEWINLDKGGKMLELKKSLTIEKNSKYNKDFCRGLIMYYDRL